MSAAREVDPLLKDLSEKKQSFRRNVASLAAELKEVRGRLASQEECFSRETRTRQEAETKAKMMEEEISRLHRNLEEKAVELKASTSAAEMYAKELGDLRLQLRATKAIADAGALSAQTARVQCSALVKELEEKDFLLKENEIRVIKLGEQLDLLMEELRAREFSQKQLKDEVSRIEHEIMQTMADGGLNKDNELREGVCPRNLDEIDKLLTVKDDEFAKLRDEIKILSAHWNLKTKEMESQLEKQRRVDQDLKKKVLKLEFCLQEARAQTRRLQRMGERSDKALKELREQLAEKKVNASKNSKKQSFWETSGFKIAVSVSMLVLVILSKR